MLIDGAALVNMLKPSGACKTFSDYAVNQLQSVQQIDIIWDIYIHNSLKVQTRERWGRGARHSVAADVKLPANWGEFLKLDSNKPELFEYFAQQTAMFTCESNKCILSRSNTLVLSPSVDVTPLLSPCMHEEADTRLIFHVSDCAWQGADKIIIHKFDTAVVVLAVLNFCRLGISEMWISFGVGEQYRYIPIHDIVRALGDEKAQAFTGCDQTSAFLGRGKNTAWATWMSYGEATPVFKTLSKQPTVQDVQDALPVLKRFVSFDVWPTEQASVRVSMMPRKFCSHKREGPLRTFPLLPMHCYNMRREWPTKLDIVGDSVWFVFQNCPLLVNGMGKVWVICVAAFVVHFT